MGLDFEVELRKAQERLNRLYPGLLSADLADRRKRPLFHGMADMGDAIIDIGDAFIEMFGGKPDRDKR